ncbi:KGGVGR-motif variant AAA ATPase [Ectothiorhodospira shaposhnikovii]|uniref:ParA family protein n=1 Tax=Ectothiorhodospira shaposhnikovii TaxID=1054 RepID=UPI0039A08DBD
MTTFDMIVPVLQEVLGPCPPVELQAFAPLIVNRDLNGRVRLVVPAEVSQQSAAREVLEKVAETLSQRLGCHAFLAGQMVLYEEDMAAVRRGTQPMPLPGVNGIELIDRLASEGQWARIAPLSPGAPRVVFFSIKGGVGRSTAMAVAAWSLAQEGKRVMVLDLDLESPGLSSGLLPESRRPAYGITDWLVEDLVDNGQSVFADLVATSTLSHDGQILVVPAHGADPGEYIAKLGRVWMPKMGPTGRRETWSQRLGRLLDELERRWQPDVVLIDSRSGIDEVASSCVTDLGATLVLLFALDGEQTWNGYRLMLDHWHRAGVAHEIRERLQLVGAMIPELGAPDYLAALREHGWDLFSEQLYDEVPPGRTGEGLWNFDDRDEAAPHHPWPIRWNRGFAALTSLHSHLETLDEALVKSTFGPLLEGVRLAVMSPEHANE